MSQQYLDVKTSINNIIEIIEKLDPTLVNDDVLKISLIVNNLNHTLDNTDKKLILAINLDNINRNLNNINSNIKYNHWNINDAYLYEIIKEIAYLNNCNGKPNLQGYSKSVNKEIDLLEAKIKVLVQQIENNVQNSNAKVSEFESSVKELNNKISDNNAQHVKNIEEFKKKYEEELKNLRDSSDEFKNTLLVDKDKISSKTTEEISNLSKKIDEEILRLSKENSTALNNFKKMQDQQLNQLDQKINTFTNEKKKQVDDLVELANEQLGRVGRATYSKQYRSYANRFNWASKFWYLLTLASMGALIYLSIYWFVITPSSELNYITLIAKIFATFGIIGLARYCSIQASKYKTIETKLRKVQLQMVTFDSFVATLKKPEQDRLKIKLAELLINQKDWLQHDKNEIDTIKDFTKIMKKLGHEVNIIKIENDSIESSNEEQK